MLLWKFPDIKNLSAKKRGKKKYLLVAGVTLMGIALAAFFSPDLRGTLPPPKPVGADIVQYAGSLADRGGMQSVVVERDASGQSFLTLDKSARQGVYTSQRLQAGYPFDAVGLHWQADMPAGAGLKEEVRLSQDGGHWGPWRTLTLEDDTPDQSHLDQVHAPRDTFANLTYGEGSRYIQYRLTLTAGANGSPRVGKIVSTYIDAEGHHQSFLSLSNIWTHIASVFKMPPARAEDGVISRAQWGADESLMTWTPEYARPQKFIIHHTDDGSNWTSDPAAAVRSIYYYHAVTNGWGDIGYNYLIDWEGNVYEGRAGGAQAPFGQSVIGGHCYGWNTGSIGIAALGTYDTSDITSAMYKSFVWLINKKANEFFIDPEGSDYFVHYDFFNNDAPVAGNPPNITGHRDDYPTDCPGAMLYAHIPQIRIDAHVGYDPTPRVSNNTPTGNISNNRPDISVDFYTPFGVNASSITFKLDGIDLSGVATRTANYVGYRPDQPLTAGNHTVSVSAADSRGIVKNYSWSFSVAANSTTPHDYYWPWYDNVNGRDWVMLANPASATSTAGFDLSIAARSMNLSSFPGGGQVAPGSAVSTGFAGYQGGPVRAGSLTGSQALVSQRTLWGNSLEETPGTDDAKLSSHYFWPWYDQQSSGMTDWVMVANKNDFPVYYEVTVGGQLKASSWVRAGGSATPSFPGVAGGPVELNAWTDPGKGVPAKVVASQRVLSFGGAAFNELPGIAAEDLSDHYYWNWYDQHTAGANDWVMIANPGASSIYYEIRLAGQLLQSGNLAAGATVSPSFPGQIGGPLGVQTWTDQTKQAPARSIASQRIFWGQSFEETPGYAAGSLMSSYAWTWYDNQSTGATDWVMVSNPGASPVYYEISVAGALKGSGTIGAGGTASQTFPGIMAGPVEVHAWTDSGKQTSANVLASQRVLWKGYFNELDGTTFPLITKTAPTGDTSENRPTISASLFSSFGSINMSSIDVKLDGNDVTAGATKTAGSVSYRPDASLAAGPHQVAITVSDSAGHTQTASWSFNVTQTNYTPQDYYWNWYDDSGGRDWLMMANPASATGAATFEAAIAGSLVDLTDYTLSGQGCPSSLRCAPGEVPAGRAAPAELNHAVGGPVRVSSQTGAAALVSQRTVWGQSSLEDTPGTAAGDLSDHYYWPWYDQQTAGMTDWVMVSNHKTTPAYYEIRLAGKVLASGALMPGQNVSPTFPGAIGGPLEVQAWTDSGKSAPAQVVASQRVLSGGGGAFNELPGIPAAKLSDHYYWPWYDQKSPGAADWVMVSNPGSASVYYELRIGGQLKNGIINPGSTASVTFSGIMTGPVELEAWTDLGKSAPASVIATQRVLWGSSFEETPGYPAGSLNSSYGWTWYDSSSPGSLDWVMVSNLNAVPVYYEVSVDGSVKASGTILAGSYAAPQLAGTMGGPVEVHAWTDSTKQVKANILASQRQLLNGYFNEVTGTVFAKEPGASLSGPSATVTASSSFNINDGAGALLTTLPAGQKATVTYAGGSYFVSTTTGYTHTDQSYIRMSPADASGIMQVTSYHDIPAWNPGLDDNLFRGAIEVRYSNVSNAVWVVNELPLEMYLRGIGETSPGSPADYYKVMTVAARGYAYYHITHGGKYGSNEIFQLKNSRNGNGDDQDYQGYGLEERFPDLVSAVTATTGQVVTYNGAPAITTYFSNSDGRTRSAQEVWGVTDWPWLASVPDPDCDGMVLAGHGVGLSAYGAEKRAERGDGFAAILGYYYSGTSIGTVDTSANIRIAITRL